MEKGIFLSQGGKSFKYFFNPPRNDIDQTMTLSIVAKIVQNATRK